MTPDQALEAKARADEQHVRSGIRLAKRDSGDRWESMPPAEKANASAERTYEIVCWSGDRTRAFLAACAAYHAAMLEGQVVISREDARAILACVQMPFSESRRAPIDRLAAQLGAEKE